MTGINGIINIYKPQDYTSHDCVNIIRKATGIKKVGHCGTLDPMATGVLPVCIGSATKAIEYFDLDLKCYRCKMQLGKISDTLDVWGNVVAIDTKGKDFNEILKEDVLIQVFSQLKGTIQQVPPKYSALKVNGRRLYDYARKGEEVAIKSRKVYIEDINLMNIDLENRSFEFQVLCGKGTYIRSICRDIGEQLGTGAIMTELVRVKSGSSLLENTVSIEDIKNGSADINSYIKNIDTALKNLGQLIINPEKQKYFINGGKISYRDMKITKKPYFADKVPPIQVDDKLCKMYLVCEKNNEKNRQGNCHCLGTAYFDQEIGAYKAHKIF